MSLYSGGREGAMRRIFFEQEHTETFARLSPAPILSSSLHSSNSGVLMILHCLDRVLRVWNLSDGCVVASFAMPLLARPMSGRSAVSALKGGRLLIQGD